MDLPLRSHDNHFHMKDRSKPVSVVFRLIDGIVRADYDHPGSSGLLCFALSMGKKPYYCRLLRQDEIDRAFDAQAALYIGANI